jgi:hypothetical protein
MHSTKLIFQFRKFLINEDVVSETHIFCADIDECLTSPCHSQSVCTNIPGNFSCTCNTGYTGNGTYCVGKTVLHSMPIIDNTYVKSQRSTQNQGLPPGSTLSSKDDYIYFSKLISSISMANLRGNGDIPVVYKATNFVL